MTVKKLTALFLLSSTKQAVIEYIELLYDRVRFRSAIGYVPPLKM
jgi:hypothetical protein